MEADVPAGRRPLALTVLCSLLFLTFLDNTIVSVALGNIQTQLGAGIASLQWVVNGYALVFAGAMLACGMIADEFGRKKVMLSGAAVFCAGSALCALAPGVHVLIAGRAVMGLGAAASEPGTLSMLRHLYPDAKLRDRAIGVWAAVSGVALAVGPVIGGVLVGGWDWRAIFWFNLGFGLLALSAALRVLPENADPDARRVDTAGALLGAGALTATVFAIIDGEQSGYGSTAVVVLFVLGAVGVAAFVARERTAAHPLLDLRYLRVPAFSTANVAAFCTYFATFSIFFFTALYLDEVVGDSAFDIALTFLPMMLLLVAGALLAGRITYRVGAWRLVAAGCVVFAVGLLWTSAVLRPNPSTAPLVIALAVAGAGIGITVVPITISALAAVPAARSSMAASTANTSREIGAVTGVSVLGAVVNAQLRGHLGARLKTLGIPPNFQAIVLRAIESGGVPPNGHTSGAGGAAGSGHAGLVQQVIHAAWAAFRSGLTVALTVSAVLVLVAGTLALLTLRLPRPGPGGSVEKGTAA
ncbi:MAG: MFS transporter [Acidimicrobiales bacterium]